jgi:alpha-ribazole phosphatase/probable phosphoglycerate mutase
VRRAFPAQDKVKQYMTIIDLLRHGEAAPGVCLGNAFNAPLTAAGWAQMQVAVTGNEAANWHGIFSSPLQRCAAFAEELASRLQSPLHIDPRWRELGFGAWEGRRWSDLYEEYGEALLAFQQNPGQNPAPGGEDYPDFERRIAGAWADLLAQAQGGHWLLIAHAGVQRAVLRKVLGFPPSRMFNIQVPNACLTRIIRLSGEPCCLLKHGGGFW